MYVNKKIQIAFLVENIVKIAHLPLLLPCTIKNILRENKTGQHFFRHKTQSSFIYYSASDYHSEIQLHKKFPLSITKIQYFKSPYQQ